ncbi:MAG: hypothetical protein AB8B60_20455 [Sulfitobacter sp.]
MTTEMKTQRQQQPEAQVSKDLDPNALAAIRNLLETETETEVVPEPQAAPTAARGAAPQTAAPEPLAQPTRVRAERPSAPPRETSHQTSQRHQAAASDASFVDRIKMRVTGYRPKPKHLILGSLALLVLLRPWLVIGILFFSVFVMVGVFLILGYDGFWRRAMGLGRWYARRRPSRAAELHRKLDSIAMKWDAVLDRFPEGSVDGLYLPDFGDMATADVRHDEALDRRFANLREGEA